MMQVLYVELINEKVRLEISKYAQWRITPNKKLRK